MNLQEAIHRYIETHRDEHIEKLREFLRQPEISRTGPGTMTVLPHEAFCKLDTCEQWSCIAGHRSGL